MERFYRDVVEQLIKENVLDPGMTVLVVCGGEIDRTVFQKAGLKNVVISNLDVRLKGNEFAPFEWSFQDAEALTFEDSSFDFCVVHSGLHHCHSPHRALLEMYRVARKGILVFEPYDNFTTRLGVSLNLGQEYEHAAVFYNDCAYGGVKNSIIPNYVYRWTKREIVKTVSTFAPHGKHRFRFIHKLRLPWDQLKGRKNKAFYLTALLVLPVMKVLCGFSRKQCNSFAGGGG